ncbi:nucleoside kinase [Peptacetobacter sp.]|uniref:nucleoside kinase n=1 Tax=Peptacetobacter sp. TaxID=2991975 RepID=UPI002638DA5B|nr:nucleoside kinase [Peptacetobacter sp.]
MGVIEIKVDNKIEVFENKNEDFIFLSDIADRLSKNHDGVVTAALKGNKLCDLYEKVYNGEEIELLDFYNEDGARVYFRGLSFVFITACRKLFEKAKVTVEHSLSNGMYYTIDIGRELTDKDIENIKSKMRNIISADCPIKKVEINKMEIGQIFRILGRIDKAELIEKKDEDKAKIYECEGYIDHFYGMMPPSTKYTDVFDIVKYKKGVVLMGPSSEDASVPEKFVDQPKLSNIYDESEEWATKLGVMNVIDLNRIIEQGNYGEVIRIVEALHEKKISQIADMIKERGSKVILIAAPSSSGKTSFAHRLSIQMKVSGVKSRAISLDDYFIEREHTPKKEDGSYDYESIKAIDVEKFNEDMNILLNGGEIEKIKYDFKTGKRIFTGEKLSIKENESIIIEGIHGLNPELTKHIDNEKKFRIYISALTQINLDSHNRIPTTDLRLVRRIVRDFNFRGYSAEETIKSWKNVREGERENIFPYQEEADVMFNSACVYELSVLKKFVDPLLKEVNIESKEYLEAARILSFMQYFANIEDTSDIPSTSIIREFIGGSKIV